MLDAYSLCNPSTQIDLILDSGKKKTQELNDKLQAAQKGDMLDFKLDGGLSAQTFEGIDYSEAKNAQFTEELLSYIDVGKRERRTVAYNENQLYMQQVNQQTTQPKKNPKKEIKLPKMLRLPKMEEWQMFDRKALYALQELEEQAFRALPEEVQLAVGGTKSSKSIDEHKNQDGSLPHESNSAEISTPNVGEGVSTLKSNNADDRTDENNDQRDQITLESLPPLLSDDQIEAKKRLLAEGFADWSRHHFTAFVKANGKYGRSNYAKIANDVGKPASSIQTYSEAFWSESFGKKRFTEHEYDRVVKSIEKGEKKIDDIKGLQRGTRVLISLFDNPWQELQFTHVNTKDKKFTVEEDRWLLCWAHKVRHDSCVLSFCFPASYISPAWLLTSQYGYGQVSPWLSCCCNDLSQFMYLFSRLPQSIHDQCQWEAIKFAIRRSSNFRFDYFLKSLPIDAIVSYKVHVDDDDQWLSI